MADDSQPEQAAVADAPMADTPMADAPMADAPAAVVAAPPTPAAPASARKRPKLDLGAIGGAPGKERKRGGMLGLLVGTLNKAKIEDKERNASDAAKKRQLTEQRLQAKLRKETDAARRADEAKADKVAALRKEEDLALRQNIHKLRRTRLPALAHFLCTTDIIPAEGDSLEPPRSNPLVQPRRTHPPALYYLPAILTPAQETFLTQRKANVKDAAEKEWSGFVEERRTTMLEIAEHRKRHAEETERHRAELKAQRSALAAAASPTTKAPPNASAADRTEGDAAMDVEDSNTETVKAGEKNGAAAEAVAIAEKGAVEKEIQEEPMQADDEEAVEY